MIVTTNPHNNTLDEEAVKGIVSMAVKYFNLILTFILIYIVLFWWLYVKKTRFWLSIKALIEQMNLEITMASIKHSNKVAEEMLI